MKRRGWRAARRAYETQQLETLRDDNERRLADLRGPGYCVGCVNAMVSGGMKRDDAIRTLQNMKRRPELSDAIRRT